MAADSDRRQAQMSIDLGGEQLVLEQMRCTEALGQPFLLTVDLIAEHIELDLLPHLGKPVTVTLYEDDQEMRHFNGLITEGEFLHYNDDGFHYRLVAQPFTYFLSQNRDMAIFQDLTVPEIIDKVLVGAGLSGADYKQDLSNDYPKRVYCVQYRESDFAFLTRLMEEEGIYYFYRHSADKHELVFVDAPTTHAASKPASLRYCPTTGDVVNVGSGQRGGDDYTLESLGERVSSGGEATVTLRSFDFEKADQPLEAVSGDRLIHPGDAREVYDYPAPYLDKQRGLDLGARRLASLRRERAIYSGRSQATSLACGTKVKVTDHPTGRFNQEYLITRTEHIAAAESYRSGGDAGAGMETEVLFDAVPASTAFHMPQITPKPRVEGLETAIVSGPSSEKPDEGIYTDEWGRVKVRFHWDRATTRGENSTCWIRVAQFGGLGSLILPRINQEVMVDFLHGDPDQPIITGWVFNSSNRPIYGLPDNKTRALWRTRRYGASGDYGNAKDLDVDPVGANELRFEDKGGHEEIFLYAERDMNTRVRHDETRHVGQNQEEKVGYDRTAFVDNNETTRIGKDQTLTVKGDQTETMEAKRTQEVKADDKLKVGMNQTIDVGMDLNITVTKSITITCGQSKIKMLPGSMEISSPVMKVKGDGTATLTSPLTTVEAQGLTKVTGATVMIN